MYAYYYAKFKRTAGTSCKNNKRKYNKKITTRKFKSIYSKLPYTTESNLRGSEAGN